MLNGSEQGGVFALLQRVHEIIDDKKNHTTSNLFEGEGINCSLL